MRRRYLLALVVFAVTAGSFGGAMARSSDCNGGDLSPGDTPAGIGIARSGDVGDTEGSATVCNNGAVAPKPAKGSATVGGSIDKQEGYVDVDGDPDNDTTDCTDGFVRVVIGPDGVTFYSSPDGRYVPSGSNRSQPKTADEFVTDTLDSCG